MKLRVLLLCNKPTQNDAAGTVLDHLSAFSLYSRHTLYTLSNIGDFPEPLNLGQFDVLIIHYSLSLLNTYYLSATAKKAIRDFKGLKVIFIQDEYRQIYRIIESLNFLKVDVLFTCFSEQEMDKIYPATALPDVIKVSNLTGYIPERLLHQVSPRIQDRCLPVGYRARQLPFWYGELGFEKWDIVTQWHKHVPETVLRSDLSYKERHRIYGDRWISFVTGCKAMLGVESGASVMDFTGELEKTVEHYQCRHPKALFHEVQRKFFSEQEGLYTLNQISPRCFEAIALKTALVLYEGHYSGILIPDRHYIMLKKDFSNIDSVVNVLQSDAFLQAMVDRAYEEIALNPAYHYRTFIAKVDEVISDTFVMRNKSRASQPYDPLEFQSTFGALPIKNSLFRVGMRVYNKLPEGLRRVVKTLLK